MVDEPITVIIEDDDLLRGLSKLSEDLAGEVLHTALEAAALLPLNEAKEMVPWITRNLMRSIHMERVWRNGRAVEIGTDVEYAARIEFGYADIDSLGRYYNQAAQPYLRPALDDTEEEMVEEFGEAIEDMVQAAFR